MQALTFATILEKHNRGLQLWIGSNLSAMRKTDCGKQNNSGIFLNNVRAEIMLRKIASSI